MNALIVKFTITGNMAVSISFKMNALVDKPCIQALYRAAQAGVRIDLTGTRHLLLTTRRSRGE